MTIPANQGVIFPRREDAQEAFVGSGATSHLYVAPANAAASDANPGNDPDAPLATLAGAFARVQGLVRSQLAVIIHLASGSYTWEEPFGPIALSQPLCIICDGAGQAGDDGFTVVQAPAAAAAGSGQALVVDPAGGLTTNVYQGKTIEILTGAAAGDRRTGRNNTATNIVPCQRFSAVVSPGDSFRIVEPGAQITMPSNGGVTLASKYALTGVGAPSTMGIVGNDARRRQNLASILLCNLSLRIPAGSAQEILLGNSQVYLAGCEVVGGGITALASDQQSDVAAGVDAPLGTLSQFALPFTLGLAASRTQWLGWGLSLLRSGGNVTCRLQRFIGFLVYQVTTTTGILIPNVEWFVAGGELNNDGAANFNGAFRFSDLARVVFAGAEAATAVRVISTAGDNRSACLRAVGGARLSLINTEVRMTGSGASVVAHGSESTTDHALEAGVVSLITGVTLEGATACAIAMTGGRVYWDDAPTVVGVPTVGQAVITQSSTNGAAVASTTFAALADGAVVVNPDGSGTVLGRVT